MWWVVIALGALQAYAVREILAAFALFVVAFTAITVLVAGVYVAAFGWQYAVARIGRSSVSVVDLTARVKANPKAS